MNRRVGIIFAVAALVLMLTAERALAETVVEDSIEWMVADSDLVARCKVVEVAGDDGPTETHWWSRVVFDVGEIFKGAPTRRVTIRTDGYLVDNYKAWLSAGGERILFFQRTDRLKPTPGDPYSAGLAKYPFQIRKEGELPKSHRDPAHPTIAFTSDFRVLRKPAEIEATIRAAATAITKPATHDTMPRGGGPWRRGWLSDGEGLVIGLDAPFGSEASDELFSGSMAFLNMPLDDRLERLAFGWYASPNTQDVAVAVLRHFKSDRSIAIFRQLISDTTNTSTMGYGGPGTRWEFPLRKVAYDTLTAWGINMPRPPINLPDDGYHVFTRPQAIGWIACGAGGLLALTAIFYLARRKISRRSRSNVRPGIRLAFLDALCLILFALGIAVVVADVQSKKLVRETTVTIGDARYWAWSHEHGLTIARAQQCYTPAELSLGSFETAGAPAERWEDSRVGTMTVRQWHGFAHATGTMVGQISTPSYGGPGAPVPYDRARLPLWTVAAGLLALPFARVITAATNRQKIRRRRRLGQCLACGYDLRGGHARCPECGAEGESLTASRQVA